MPQRRPAHDVAQRRTMFAPYRIDHRPSQQTDPKIEQCEEKWRDASVRKAAVGLSQEFAEELKVGWTLTTSGMSWVRWRWVCILVRVHLELTSKSAPGQVVFKLQLQPAEMGMRFANGNTKPGEDEFTINSVPAGRYSAVPMPTYGYVDRMTCGGTNLLEQSLVVTGSGSPEPIHVTIRDDTATLSGNIQTGDDARSGRSFVFLLSEQGNHPIQTSVAINGEFTFGNIPPGTYRLFAVPISSASFLTPQNSANISRKTIGSGYHSTRRKGVSLIATKLEVRVLFGRAY